MRNGSGGSTFRLLLPKSILDRATEIAREEGISLNQFITLAVSEKNVRMHLEPAAKVVKRKRGKLTAEGRKRIGDAQRRRWAKQRTKQS